MATLVAASIGGSAAIVAAVLGGFNAWRSRQWTRREQWWGRFSWACEKSVSLVPGESELGLSVLAALIDTPWAKDEDSEMTVAVSNVIVAARSPEEQRDDREWW